MYALKRQLRIWKHELATAWDRIPFYGRIVLGAGIALGMSLLCVEHHLKPLNEELAGLRKGLLVPENLDPETDDEIIMNRDKTVRLQQSLREWKDRLAIFEKESVVLRKEAHLNVIADLQGVLDRCGMMLVSESLIVPVVEPPGRSGRKAAKPAAVKQEGPLGLFSHQYEVRGTFRQLQAFLLLVEELEWRFQLRDLQVRPQEETNGTLSLTFVLDIFYLRTEG
jgi:hypothetical protein